MSICDLTELDETMCAHCRKLTLEDAKPEVDYTFTAKFSGWCSICNHTIEVGDRMARLTDGDFGCEGCTK